MDIATEYPELRPCLTGKDIVDVKTITARADLRTFVARMMSYYPWWLRALYGVREVLVRLLGLVRHEVQEGMRSYRPDEIPFAPGGRVQVFIVEAAREEAYWVVTSPPDKHLTAWFGVAVEALGDGRNRFHVLTTVAYVHWTGPVYYNLIRPFHHLVVRRMMAAGARD